MSFATADVCGDARIKQLVSLTFWPLCSLEKSTVVHFADRVVELSADPILSSKYIHTPRKLQF